MDRKRWQKMLDERPRFTSSDLIDEIGAFGGVVDTHCYIVYCYYESTCRGIEHDGYVAEEVHAF